MNGLIFVLGSLVYFEESKVSFAALQIIAGIINFILLAKSRKTINKVFNIAALALNIVVAISVSVDYFLSGKTYIQYLWMLTALFSAIALVVYLQKRQPN